MYMCMEVRVFDFYSIWSYIYYVVRLFIKASCGLHMFLYYIYYVVMGSMCVLIMLMYSMKPKTSFFCAGLNRVSLDRRSSGVINSCIVILVLPIRGWIDQILQKTHIGVVVVFRCGCLLHSAGVWRRKRVPLTLLLCGTGSCVCVIRFLIYKWLGICLLWNGETFPVRPWNVLLCQKSW